MKVKKFNCDHCGAPKIEPYTNPYVVCDYCCEIIDVDYAAGLQVWNRDPDHTNQYNNRKIKYLDRTKKFLESKNQQAYWQETYEFWDFYYTHYPEYLPPNIPKGEKYNAFMKATADMMTDSAFNPPPSTKYDHYMKLYGGIQYYQEKGTNYVEFNSFQKMLDAYMEVQEQGFRICYDDDKYKVFQELLPEKFHYKMKLSQIIQTWIPYLKTEEVTTILEKYHLQHEYINIDPPQKVNIVCEDCKKDLTIPEGALKCICTHCRHENVLLDTVHCGNCGDTNKIPDQWNLHIDCGSCGAEIRVVKPLFG